jgi:hypothetical protein
MSSLPSNSSTEDTSASYRNTDVLLILLVVSNIVLGGLSIYLLRKFDRDFTRLMDRTLPVLHELRSTGRQGSMAYRSLMAAAVTTDPAKRTELIGRAESALALSQQLRLHVLESEIMQERPALAGEFRATGEAYERMAASFIARAKAIASLGVGDAKFDELRPIFENHVTALTDCADFVEQRSQEMSQEFSREVRGRSTLILGLASWPALIVVALGGLLAVVVVLFTARRAGIGTG